MLTITVSGPIGSGKTVAAEAIALALSIVGFRVCKHDGSMHKHYEPLVVRPDCQYKVEIKTKVRP